MKKLTGLILFFALLINCTFVQPIHSEENIIEARTINEVYYNEPQTYSEEEEEYEPIVHEEVIAEDIEFPEDGEYRLFPEETSEDGIAVASLTSDVDIWKRLYGNQFGDSYLRPYEKHEESQYVSGNTNRLTVQETDLHLPGKNGLDVTIKRKHDNQDFDYVYRGVKLGSLTEFTSDRFLYKFKNTTTGGIIYIGFFTKDHFYEYEMYNGCYISNLTESDLSVEKVSGGSVAFYRIETVLNKITSAGYGDFYEWTGEAPSVLVIKDEANGQLISVRTKNNSNILSYGWRLILPEMHMCAYYSSTRTSSAGNQTTDREYAGAFTDMYGNIHTLQSEEKFVRNYDDTITYTSTYTPDNNNLLKVESFFYPQSIDGIEYNFVVHDQEGLTYYMYNTAMHTDRMPELRQFIYIVAIKDTYGNTIKYEYENGYGYAYGDVTKIIDTYGREINIETTDTGKQISYYDEACGELKTIVYKDESLPPEILDNDSTIKAKYVRRLTVTNSEGESTIYDSRIADSINYYSIGVFGANINRITSVTGFPYQVSSQSNIERIIYPNGDETRYKYKFIYPYNYTLKLWRGIYAVTESYDIIDGETVNKKQYSFSSTEDSITKDYVITNVCTESDKNKITTTVYSDDGMITSFDTIDTNALSYEKEDGIYKYDENRNPTYSKTTIVPFGTKETWYTYNANHKPTMERDSKKKITYEYHSNGVLRKISYYKNVNSNFVLDYYTETTLTEVGKEVEYERTIKDGIIISQKKYEYDDCGNVVAIKQWKDDTNADGVLDENDDVILLSNTYTVTDQKTVNVTESINDILNADGANEGNINVETKFNSEGYPLSVKDSYGNEATAEYDKINRPTKYTLPDGGTRTIEYDISQNIIISTNELGVTIKSVYDLYGNIKAEYRKNGDNYEKIAEYSYDAGNRLSEKISYRNSSEGTKETYTYSAFDKIKSKKVYELPNTLLYTENYSYGNNSVLKTIVGETISMEMNIYDGYNNLTKVEKSYTNQYNNKVSITNTYTYDHLDRLTSETDPLGNVTTYTYNCLGQVTTQTDALGNVTTTNYDLAGRPISVTDANGNVTNTYYDNAGRVVKVVSPFDDTQNAETKTYYDKNSNVIKNAVKKNATEYQTEEYKYDNMNNLLATITENGTDDAVTQYEYDKAGNITKMITGLTAYSQNPTGGAVTKYSYNNLGQLSAVTDPMGMTEAYTYDYMGNLVSKTDKNSNTIDYTYGVFGLLKESDADTNQSRDYTYDNIGRLKTISSTNANGETVSEEYMYDEFNRLSKVLANGYVHTYTYDLNSNVLLYRLFNNNAIKNDYTYTYNALNQPISITNNGVTTQYSYDGIGNLTKKSLSNGVVTDYTYNKGGYMVGMENKIGEAVDSSYTNNYSPDGLLNSVTTNNSVRQYNYDNLGRLIQETTTKDGATILQNQYSYDNFGNRTAMATSGAENYSASYTYDKNNRLVTQQKMHNNITDIWDYTYDNNGNQVMWLHSVETEEGGEPSLEITTQTDGTDYAVYSYDAFNRLAEYTNGVTTAKYTYNANNLRTSKTVNDERTDFIWNGQNLVASASGDIANYYTYDGTGIHSANINGTVYNYLKDEHGNVTGLTDSTGAKHTEVYEYDAFGNQKSQNANTINPFRYCGEYFDEETGLIYLRNRYYDTAMGRFINEDPVKDGLNWYVYCENNPVNYVDFLGLDAVLITANHAAGYAGHTSVLTQDTRNGNWYYFYWGDKATYFVEVPWEDGAMSSLDNFNSWLDKQDLPYSTKKYTSATFVEGDFNSSVDYFKNLVSNTMIKSGYKISGTYNLPKMEYYQKNMDYDLLSANCLQMTLKGFYKGDMKDGTSLNSFMSGQSKKTLLSSTIPNQAENVFGLLFLNKRFTREAAKNDLVWEVKYGTYNGVYKDKGVYYANTLGVRK